MFNITNQRDLRRAFWEDHPNLPRRKIRNYSGNGTMHQTDTRCAWVDWLDYMCKSNYISAELADRATL